MGFGEWEDRVGAFSVPARPSLRARLCYKRENAGRRPCLPVLVG